MAKQLYFRRVKASDGLDWPEVSLPDGFEPCRKYTSGENTMVMPMCVRKEIDSHVHDEVIVETPMETTVEEITEKMSLVPPWADGLVLKGDGYESGYYCKDS